MSELTVFMKMAKYSQYLSLIESNHEVKCAIPLRLIISLLLSYISNAWKLSYSVSVHVSAKYD